MKKNKLLVASKNNKGIALISIMIAVAFISIIGAALLYITYTNFKMKAMNLNSKENFYEVDGQLTRITTGVRQEVYKGSGKIDSRIEPLMTKYDGANYFSAPDADNTSTGKYCLREVAKLAYDDPEDETAVKWQYKDGASWVAAKFSDIPDTATKIKAIEQNGSGDSFIYDSSSTLITKKLSGNISTYTFNDFKVIQKNHEGYQNNVKTEIEFKALEIPGGSSGGPGGIGEFSMLSDANLDCGAAKFACLNINGNCYFSSKNNSIDKSWPNDNDADDTDKGYTAPGRDGTNPGLKLSGESKINMMGEYLVVFGDVVLEGKSSLYVSSKCKMTVYGDIIIKDNALLILNDDCEVYLVKKDNARLPGRSSDANPSSIKATDNNLKKHLYPYNVTVKELSVDDYKEFAKTLKMDDSKLDNDGVNKQIFTPIKNFGGTVDATTHLKTGGTTFDITKGAEPKDEKYGKTKYFGQECGVFYYTQGNMNNICNDALIINFKNDLKLSDNAKKSTIISTKSIYLEQVNAVTLSKIGAPVFDFLTIKSCEDGNSYIKNENTGKAEKVDKNPNFDNNVHKVTVYYLNGSEYHDSISAGDLFTKNANTIVNNMLLKSTAVKTDDADTEPTYKTSLSFTKYEKDFDYVVD